VVVTPRVDIPETLSCLENNVGPVTVVIPAKVERPVMFRLEPSMVPTVILGVPVSPCAVVAVPVKEPKNVVAVTNPTLIFDGSLELSNVPEDILLAFNNVIPIPDPTKDDAVIIPEALMLPPELIPTPFCPSSDLPPICNDDVGEVVAIPTFPAA